MNRSLFGEKSRRRTEWTEGRWIKLSNGEEWSFPSPDQVPGYTEKATVEANRLVDSIMTLLNGSANAARIAKLFPSDASHFFSMIKQSLILYRIAFELGSILLRHNYNLTENDCEALMPFGYQVEDLFDPDSRIHRTTPETLQMSNTVAASLGIDIGPIFSRITASN